MVKLALFGGLDARVVAIQEAILAGEEGEKNKILTIGETNPQIAAMAQLNVANASLEQILYMLKSWKPDLAATGPEKILMPLPGKKISLVNILEKKGIGVAAPSYPQSLIELNKAWMIGLFLKYGMRKFLPESVIVEGIGEFAKACRVIDEFGEVAIKPEGLTGGKGVKVTGDQLADKEEAKKYIRELLTKGGKAIIQKKIRGREFCLQAFVDKYGFIVFAPAVEDFKKLYDGNIAPNPNTGSMGSRSYANGRLPFLSRAALRRAKTVIIKAVAAIEEETSKPYQGPIYGQFMLLENGDVVVIEFNARLGNPEAINILPLLRNINYAELCERIIDGTLSDVKINFAKEDCIVKYIVPVGYGYLENPKQVVINFGATNFPVRKYLGGIVEDGKGNLLTVNSRAVAIRGSSANIVNNAIQDIFCSCLGQLHWRSGIGLDV